MTYNAADWKPGDVALMDEVGIVFHYAPLDCDDNEWVSATQGGAYPGNGYEVRRLLVLDPEDRAHVERLRDLIDEACRDQTSGHGHIDIGPVKGQRGNALQAALPAMLTPPKPDEPLGLGAVVRDAGGRCLVRSDVATSNPWRDDRGIPHEWDGFHAVEVLSTGVTP